MVILLKKNIRIFIKTVALTSFALLFFIGVGFVVLTSKVTLVETKQEKVPYYESVPQNTNILFSVLDTHTLLCLDFEKNNMKVLSVEDLNDTYSFSGYDTDFYVECDLNNLADIIDILGGIPLETEEGTLNFTGLQIKEMLEYNKDKEIRKEIKKNIIVKISQIGFSKDNFLYIIKNSNTNLTVPDCYRWEEYIKTLCKNAIFVN